MKIMINDDFMTKIAGKIDWIEDDEKSFSTNRSNKDITISIVKQSKSEHKQISTRFNIYFRNDVSELFESEYVKIGTLHDRMYFDGSSVDSFGYKFYGNTTTKGSTKVIYVKRDKKTEHIADWVGSYDLKFDKYSGLYFIEKKEQE